MTPRLSFSYEVHSRLADAISRSDDSGIFVGISNLQYGFISQFCSAMPYTPSMSILLSTVRAILTSCARKQMFWIDAGWVIATMQHIQIFWYRALEHLKRASMCKIFFRVFCSPILQNSISELMASSLPLPTWCIKLSKNLFDSGKKPFFGDFLSWRCHANNIWRIADIVK